MGWAMNMPALMTPKNAATTSNVATNAHLHCDQQSLEINKPQTLSSGIS
jgi:hypothetical protein